MIDYIKRLPRKLVVADFGCGEAQIAASCVSLLGFGWGIWCLCATAPASVPNVVHSFDLVAANERVTACDVSHVPLADQTVDIGIFCLSLMGTNFSVFLQEAHRVLKLQGRLVIAEVKSRIQSLDDFIRLVERVGFEFVTQVWYLFLRMASLIPSW